MEAPDKIYVSRPIYNQCGLVISEDKPMEYIRKDLLLEWAKEEQAECSSKTHPYAMFMNVVIDKLNSL